MKSLEKNDLRREYIIPALDIFESIMDKDANRGSFWNEVLHHPEYPASKVFAWLNHLEQSMCDSEPASEFEILVCKRLPKLAEILANHDICSKLNI